MNSKILKRNTFHRKSTPLLKTYFLKEENAINLIDIKRDKLILNEDAIKTINEIKENIIIVSIFGKVHTGKSYLMNLLLNSDENSSKPIKGFKVTSQSNSSPRGLYLWNSPIKKPNSKEKILFIDSDGLNSENVYQQGTDSKLMALILLISSLFIYNTSGDINSNSLNELQLIIHLADSVGINEKINKDKLIAELCPKFIWAVRDFDIETLEEKIDPDAYMDKCLKERFDGKNKDEINVIKENLIKYFKKRECVTLPKPVEEEKDLIMLKRMPFNELQENFKNEFFNLKDKVYNSSKAKIINGKIINGPTVAYLLTRIVKEINDEKIPNISNIFNDMTLYHIENSFNHSKNIFKERLDKLESNQLDLDIKEIYSIKYEAIKEYMSILEKYPEISRKDVLLKEYNLKREKLEKEIEKQIKKEINTLIENESDEDLYSEKDKDINKEYIKSDELIEDYLNGLSEIKINSDNAIINNKDFDNFINNDIQKTKEIIDFMEKHNELSSKNRDLNEEEKQKFKTKETDYNTINNKEEIDEEEEYEKLKQELEDTEKNALELIGKFTKLLDKRDKYIRPNSKPSSFHYRHSIKSYSNKLVNIYFNEDKLCEISSEEKPTEKCYCNMEKIKSNCNIY